VAMNIIDHPALAGRLKHVAASSGGEFAGPCPWCGGDDRFRVWPEHPSGAAGGKFMCRRCGWQGDGIQFVRDMSGVSYADACRQLGVSPKGSAQAGRTPRSSKWEPKASELPGNDWIVKAESFVTDCQAAMDGPGLEYAMGRGLTYATIQALRIGWNPRTDFDERAAWGLSPEVNEQTGKPRRVWRPGGLVIPTCRDGQVVAVKTRRTEWKPGDNLPKYVAVSGSSNAPMVLAAGQGKPVVVVESEIDAILVAQESRDLVAAIALRTAKAKPDDEAHELLKAAPVILVATDADEAGATAWPWWREHYPKAVRWPVPTGKDVGDCAATPGLIRAWIEAGLPKPEWGVDMKPSPIPEPPSPAVPSTLRRAAELAHGEPCPYDAAQLAIFAISHPSLRCCPATKPHAWGWIKRSWCESRCKIPCHSEVSYAD